MHSLPFKRIFVKTIDSSTNTGSLLTTPFLINVSKLAECVAERTYTGNDIDVVPQKPYI